jgi:hypothetical protein
VRHAELVNFEYQFWRTGSDVGSLFLFFGEVAAFSEIFLLILLAK